MIQLPHHRVSLRRGQRLGKYRILRRLSSGGFAEVFAAEDTIEGIRIALRVPRPDIVDESLLANFRQEVRLVARLEHPNVLPVKSADMIDGIFVMSTLLGEETLADALERRMDVATILVYIEQLLRGVAHAHESGIIHCDIKPDNLILFPDKRLRLADFGIAKATFKTLHASGAGTVGYLAPEQALGKPSARSDVFAIGLVVWELLTGAVPEWPFEWPPDGIERARRKVTPELIDWVRRAVRVDQRSRWRDAGQMLQAYERLKSARKLLPRKPGKSSKKPTARHWREVRKRDFVRRFRSVLGLNHSCGKCGGAMGEEMRGCPWCGNAPRKYTGVTRLPARCPRCARGRKLDWRFCAWCYGPAFKKVAERAYTDKRYVARCTNRACTRKDLLAHSRYCPWCRVKIAKKWTFEGADARCKKCGCGVVAEHWRWCPWCKTKIAKKR